MTTAGPTSKVSSATSSSILLGTWQTSRACYHRRDVLSSPVISYGHSCKLSAVALDIYLTRHTAAAQWCWRCISSILARAHDSEGARSERLMRITIVDQGHHHVTDTQNTWASISSCKKVYSFPQITYLATL